MIASVRGTVAALGPDGAVVEVGGVGLSVSCSPGTLARLRVGEAARLATSLVVREDSLTLYGFADDDERALFELLQTANGVGPKLAQTMLAVHPPRELRRAIATSDFASLTAVPGIGRKGAERIVIELRDRIGSIDGSDAEAGTGRRHARSRRGATSSRTRWPGSASPARRPATRSRWSPPTPGDSPGRLRAAAPPHPAARTDPMTRLAREWLPARSDDRREAAGCRRRVGCRA